MENMKDNLKMEKSMEKVSITHKTGLDTKALISTDIVMVTEQYSMAMEQSHTRAKSRKVSLTEKVPFSRTARN